MTTYLAKRLLLMIPTLFGVSLVVWVVLSLAPEPPIESQMPSDAEGGQRETGGEMSQAVKVFRAQYGLDKPRILNFYYSVDPADVEAALNVASGLDKEYSVKEKSAARERLINWGYYGVPALVQLAETRDGALRDQAMLWAVQSASRVTNVPPGGRIDAATAAQNEEITRENEILKAAAWRPGDPEARKLAGAAALRAWMDGRRGRYSDEGVVAAEVTRALDAEDTARFDEWGPRAVPALVQVILEDSFRARKATAQLARSALRPVPEDDEIEAEAAKLHNRVLNGLTWSAGAPDWQRDGAVAAVNIWWEGSGKRWDYGGAKWLRVLFLETQFARYWGNLLRFDLGNSTTHKRPVLQLVAGRLKYSLSLALPALFLAFLIAVPLGLLSATIHGSWSEKAMALFVFALYSLPTFFTATLLIRFLAEGQPNSQEIIPPGDFESVNAWQLPTWDRIRHIAWHLAAPLFCMTYASLAAYSRYAKGGLLNVIRSDYVRTARAKGLSEFRVILKHAARNGIIPIITLLGTTLPVVIGGSFIIETIFNIPGFGLLAVDAVKGNDYNVIVGTTLITAVLVMIGILLSDLLYAAVDPRISLS